MKLSIRYYQTGCLMKLFVALMGLCLIPEAMGETNCTKYCFESLCSPHNGPAHSNCLEANMNCNCFMKMTDRDRDNVVGLSFLGLVGLFFLMMHLCKQLKCECCFKSRSTSCTTCNRAGSSSTTGSDPDSSINSQLSDSQTGSPQTSSASSTVIPIPDDFITSTIEESQSPKPEDDLPPEYPHPPRYPSPPEYTSHVVNVDEMESPDKQHAKAKELNLHSHL